MLVATAAEIAEKVPKKNREYWQGRFEILEEAEFRKGAAYFNALDREYVKASTRINTEIESWYQRFADNNQISMAEARRWLNNKELAEFKWTVQDYIKYGEENALNGKWIKQLENASARVHISRLEALQLNLQQQVEVLFGNQVDGLSTLARDIYTNSYYQSAFEIQRGYGMGWNIQGINSKRLNSVLSKPWTLDGRTFSDRIWGQKQQLLGSLQTELSQAFIRGDPLDRVTDSVVKQFKVSRGQAERLVRTESAYFSAVAEGDMYKAMGLEKYQILATLDSKTSEICRDLDGEICDVKDYQSGVTAPPFHANCRTTTIPYFEDNYGERVARDADGNVYYVPADTTYHVWKARFVDGAGLAASVGDVFGSTTVVNKGQVDKGNPDGSLNEFAQEYAAKELEYARIVTADGVLYDLKGDKYFVNIAMLGEELKGAKVIHNHPLGTKDSFSKADFQAFFAHELSELQVVSGDLRNTMGYTGRPITGDEAAKLYGDALDRIRFKAMQTGVPIGDFEQLEIMRELQKTMKGLVFIE